MSNYLKDNEKLIKEYNYERNKNIDLSSLTCGSGKKIWWKCKNGHEWEASIYNRNRGKSCPYCSGHSVIIGENDLLSLYPEIAKEWDCDKNGELKPFDVAVNSHKKVWWKCKEGHSYEAIISDRTRNGHGCSYCSNKKVAIGINDLTTTRPDLLEEWDYEKNNELGIYPTAVHKGSSKKVWWKCKKCGFEWYSIIYNRALGHGCPECGKKKQVDNFILNKIDKQGSVLSSFPEIAEEWNYEKNGELKPDMFSPGSNKKVWWKCKKCGFEWEAIIVQRCKYKTQCSKCAGVHKKTDEEFKEEINNANPNVEIMNEYINAKTRLKCRCKECGFIWNVVAYHLQQGQGCPQCAIKKNAERQTLTQKEFNVRIKKINSNIEIIGKYNGAHKRIKVKCKNCNHTWNPKAWELIQGNGCPKCSHTATSYMEQFILLSFIELLGKDNVLSRDRKEIGRELDIYIPKFKYAIEPGSWFWHKKNYLDDINKINLCKKKGIDLVVIYDLYDSEIALDNPNIITYNFDLARRSNMESLIDLVRLLFNRIGFKSKFSNEKWNEISNKAYISSRMKSTDEFKKELYKKNKKVIVIGEYTGSGNKIQVKCKKCDYIWETTPGHLLEGKACPKCGKVLKKTQEEFIEQLKIKQPNIIVKGKYINTKKKIKVECSVCGNVWYAVPSNLLYGYGCRKCGFNRTAKKLSKPVLQYSLDGKFIKRYDSCGQASRELKISRGGITRVCNGKAKTCNGYKWKYE